MCVGCNNVFILQLYCILHTSLCDIYIQIRYSLVPVLIYTDYHWLLLTILTTILVHVHTVYEWSVFSNLIFTDYSIKTCTSFNCLFIGSRNINYLCEHTRWIGKNPPKIIKIFSWNWFIWFQVFYCLDFFKIFWPISLWNTGINHFTKKISLWFVNSTRFKNLPDLLTFQYSKYWSL